MRPFIVVLSWLLPALALAQEAPSGTRVAQEVRSALEAGDLLSAGTALDRGLALESLTRTELIALYELRALLAYADDRLGLLEESLAALATLEAEPPSAFPPPLRARYAELLSSAQPIDLSIELVAEVHEGRRTLRVLPVATRDPGRLVRSLVVRLAVDEGALALVSADEVTDVGDPHRVVELRYAVEAIGPGRTVIGSRGSSTRPEEELIDALPVDETFLHVALVVVGTVLLASGVATAMAYLATDGFTTGQPTRLASPSCTGAPCGSAALFRF